MKKQTYGKVTEELEEIHFSSVASQRHINFDNLRELAYIIYDSPLEKKMRKKYRNKQGIKNKRNF